MTRPNVPNWQIFFQEDKRELATQGTVTSNIYSYAFGKTLLSKVT